MKPEKTNIEFVPLETRTLSAFGINSGTKGVVLKRNSDNKITNDTSEE